MELQLSFPRSLLPLSRSCGGPWAHAYCSQVSLSRPWFLQTGELPVMSHRAGLFGGPHTSTHSLSQETGAEAAAKFLFFWTPLKMLSFLPTSTQVASLPACGLVRTLMLLIIPGANYSLPRRVGTVCHSPGGDVARL